MTPLQIGLLSLAGVVGLFVVGPSLKGAAGRFASFFTKAKAGDLPGAVADAIASSPIIQKATALGATGKNIVSYTDLKVASTIVPSQVDPDKRTETEAAFATILTNVATAKVGQQPAPQPLA